MIGRRVLYTTGYRVKLDGGPEQFRQLARADEFTVLPVSPVSVEPEYRSFWERC